MRPLEYIKRFTPRIFDTRLIVALCASVAIGVFAIVWNARSLRLVVDGHNFSWICLVAFGIVWTSGREMAWRTASGVLFGAIAALASMYGGMSLFPIIPFVWGLWLGLAIGVATAICLFVPRVASFGGMAIGFGVGMGVGLMSGFDPATSAVTFLNVFMTVVLAMIAGTLGAQALHAVVVAFDGVHTAHVAPKSMRYRARTPVTRRATKAS